jgi:hypothetical protein
LETVKKSDTQLEAEISIIVNTFICDRCEQSFVNEKGLNIHLGKTHKENIPQIDGSSDEIVADEAVEICNLKKHDDDSTKDEEVDKKQIEEPFELNFKEAEKKHSSDVNDSYLEEPLPLVMPQTLLHPLDGVGVFDGFYKKIKNKYTYRFKTNRGTSWKIFHIGEKSPWN